MGEESDHRVWRFGDVQPKIEVIRNSGTDARERNRESHRLYGRATEKERLPDQQCT